MDHDLAVKSQACEKYLLGELSPDLRDAYEEHYFSCVECATQLRMAAELIGAGQRILAEPTAVVAPTRNEVPASGGWPRWLRPAFALPVMAGLLLIAGYQNLVTIPQLKRSQAPRVLPMFSLIAANTRGEAVPVFTTQPEQPVGLYVDVPADTAYSTYMISLEEPTGETIPLRSLTYAEAQKTQVVVINPGKIGQYVLVITGQPNSSGAPLADLARLQFGIAFTDHVMQH
jgi:Putative zinc-finger